MGLRNLQKWLVSARCLFGQTATTLEKHIQEICHYFINQTTINLLVLISRAYHHSYGRA
jgi:hypothetical protein